MTRYRLVEVIHKYRTFTVVRFKCRDHRVGVRVCTDSNVSRAGDKHSAVLYGAGLGTNQLHDGEVTDDMHEVALRAIAYHQLTEDIEGFPEVEFTWPD